MMSENELREMLKHEEWLIGYNMEIAGMHSSLVFANKTRVELLKKILKEI